MLSPWQNTDGYLSAKERAKRPHDLCAKHHQIDDHNADEHHHGVPLDLLGAFGCFFFQVVLFDLPHIKADHLKVHPLVIAAQHTDQATHHIGQHGTANTGLKVNEGIFIVASLHIGNRLVELCAKIFACYPTVGGKDFQHIPVVLQILPNRQGKAGNLTLNELTALFYKVKDTVIGGEPQRHR